MLKFSFAFFIKPKDKYRIRSFASFTLKNEIKYQIFKNIFLIYDRVSHASVLH